MLNDYIQYIVPPCRRVSDISRPHRHNSTQYRLFGLPLRCAERLLSAARLSAAVSSSDLIGERSTQCVCVGTRNRACTAALQVLYYHTVMLYASPRRYVCVSVLMFTCARVEAVSVLVDVCVIEPGVNAALSLLSLPSSLSLCL